MAHEVHTTEAIVVGSADIGEADKLYWLLTKDFGLICAKAQSVREEVSKLRYALGDLRISEISLVHGKTSWRITGALIAAHIPQLPHEQQVVFGRITALVRRMMPESEESERIFTCVLAAYLELVHAQPAHAYCVELTTVIRVLHVLGYVPHTTAYARVLHTDDTFLDDHIIEHMIPDIVSAINTALSESQL